MIKKGKHIPIDSLEISLIDRFESMVKMFPENIAIIDGGRKISYQELDKKANQLANKIKQSGNTSKQHALFIEHGLAQVVSIIGILKTGCAYIPVDTTWPAHRIEQILTKSSAGLILTNNLNIGQAKAFSGRSQVLNTEEQQDTSEVFTSQSGPDDIIHILFTSGSSGEPKGVYTDHRSQVHFVKRFSEFLNISPSDRFAYHFSIGFSAHAMPLFGILLNGGTLCMYDLKNKGFQGLASYYSEQEISIALMIPSLLRHFRMTLTKGMKFKHVRALLIGGETLYYNDIKLIQPYLKRQTEIINIYASTEAFLARAYRLVNSEAVMKQNIIPIGYEIDGMEINILNEEGKICGPQQIGEMIIKSPYLARGYWNDPENSARDFSQEDGMITFRSKDLAYTLTDGAIVHVGRKDAVVKIRGQRVDLGEIENILLSNQIQEVAAVIKEDPVGNKKLIAYFVASPDSDLNDESMKNYLIKHIPDFMVPSYFRRLDTLPKTESGKTDYKALPDPEWEKQVDKDTYKDGGTPTELQLVEIFERQLDIHPIGIRDNILDSGLDSLKLFVAFDTVEKHFKVKVDIDFLVERPTLEALGEYIDRQRTNKT